MKKIILELNEKEAEMLQLLCNKHLMAEAEYLKACIYAEISEINEQEAKKPKNLNDFISKYSTK